MSAIINHITLINWFNYKGGGFVKGNRLKDENRIEFSPGTNVLVGTNNAGKTKLHNAFRYILTDKVILKVEKEEGNTAYERTDPKDPKSALEIFNKSAYRELKVGEKGVFGVALEFTKEFTDKKETYQIRKIITLKKKDDKECEEIEEKKEVYRVNMGGPVPDDSFKVESCEQMLMPKLQRDFFLIEGEQMGMMTPLKGQGLKNTINNLTKIAEVQKKVELVDGIQKKINTAVNSHRKSLKNLTSFQKTQEEKRAQLEKVVEGIKDNIESLKNELNKINSFLNATKIKHDESQKNKKLLSQIEELEREKADIDGFIDQENQRFVKNLTDPSVFAISKKFNSVFVSDKLRELDSDFADFIDKRRVEKDKKHTEEHKRFLSELVTSQPSPDILKKMLKEEVCFVCTSKIQEKNKDFIENVLIPTFENMGVEDDDEIRTIKDIKDSIKSILSQSLSSLEKDEKFFKDNKDALATLHTKKRAKETEIDEFIATHGQKDDISGGISEVALQTFNKKLKESGGAEQQIKQQEAALKNKQVELKKITDELNRQIEDKKSKTLQDLKDFIDDLDKHFDVIKTDVYEDFARLLEEKATKRFASFMKNNELFKHHKLRVKVKTTEDVANEKKEFEIEVFLESKQGDRLTQEGGASSTFEPLSVVFGLIDYSKDVKTCPFIADAPISRVTPDTKEAFFETVMEDSALSLNILICMDLWDNKTGMTPLAERVLERVKKRNDASFLLLNPKANNMGVEIQNYHSLTNNKN